MRWPRPSRASVGSCRAALGSRAEPGEYLWAERYDTTLDDAFAIQRDVEQRVVLAVGAVLGASEQQARVEAPTATPVAAFERATQLDPRNALLFHDLGGPRTGGSTATPTP